MKTVLFVPGFKENLKSRDYSKVIKAIESKGYKAKFVQVNWDKTVVRHWVEELDKVYAEHDPKQTILAGFSFGSLTAFLSATKCNPSELWLFSLSPYFSDDIPKLKKSWKTRQGHRRVDAFRELDFAKLAKKINCRTLILLGEVEAKKYPLLQRRANIARDLIAKSKVVTVPAADHDVADKNYISAIVGEI